MNTRQKHFRRRALPPSTALLLSLLTAFTAFGLLLNAARAAPAAAPASAEQAGAGARKSVARLAVEAGQTGRSATAEARLRSSASQSLGEVKYAIVVTGTELLTGVYADAHTQFLTRTLRPLGYRCVLSVCVGDAEDDIVRALESVAPRVDFLIVTGGLGPTDTDLTRQAISRFTATRLRLNENVVRHLENRFGRPFRQLPPGAQREALVPEGGDVLPNRHGTAVGLVFEGHPLIVALPGPPSELRAMVRDELVPRLVKRFGRAPQGCAFRLRFVGIGQSQITDALHRRVQLPDDVVQTTQFHAGRVDFTFQFPSDSPADRRRMKSLKAKILEELGEYIYADDDTSLEEHVLHALAQKGQRLAVLECFTAGRLSGSLTRYANGSTALVGAIIGPSDKALKQLVLRCSSCEYRGSFLDGLQSPSASQQQTVGRDQIEDDAVSLARRARRSLGADWVVWIGEARATARGTKSVRLFVLGPTDQLTQRNISVRDASDDTRDRAVTAALDLFRRALANKL